MKKITLILIGLALLGCKKQASEDADFSKPEATQATEKSELLTKAENFFKSISTVEYQSVAPEMADLGKKLYFDKALSKNQTVSCNSCHNLATFGVDNKPLSVSGRNVPTTIYASLHAMQFWDGHAKSVEEQAEKHILNSKELGIPSKEFLEKRLRGMSEYQTMFKKVFPNETEPITFANIVYAIGVFEHQLQPKSKFDDYLDGNESALNDQEKKGLTSFIDNSCITCHMGVALGGQMVQKFGVYGDYQKYTHSKKTDKGLYDFTKKEGDQFLFKVPGLRNVEKTGPYFHDGSVASLKEAVQIVGKLQLDKDISDSDADDIMAFLKTLTADVDAKYKQ